MSTYQSNLEQKFPSLKDVEHILHELKIKDIEEFETDYKGEERPVRKWILKKIQ